jgi:hypothetical protein
LEATAVKREPINQWQHIDVGNLQCEPRIRQIETQYSVQIPRISRGAANRQIQRPAESVGVPVGMANATFPTLASPRNYNGVFVFDRTHNVAELKWVAKRK